MCMLIEYQEGQQTVRARFIDPAAVLPVGIRRNGGGAILLPWGRRQQQNGHLPLGGWARLNAIHAGRWDHWLPMPVKLLVTAFAENDIEGRPHRYELTKGQWIQGLVAQDRHERRIYVVTITPEMEDAVHDRWPRILTG